MVKVTKIFLAAVLAAGASWSRAGEETLMWDDPAAHVTIRGTLSFTREKDALSFVKCPEGFPEDRLALMSARGEICGYLTRSETVSRTIPLSVR